GILTQRRKGAEAQKGSEGEERRGEERFYREAGRRGGRKKNGEDFSPNLALDPPSLLPLISPPPCEKSPCGLASAFMPRTEA
ncbi:MAG: hypothetical protein ACMG6S_31905, partial [Byssovorax sp.]